MLLEFQTIECSAFFSTCKLSVTGYKKKNKKQMDSNKLKVRRANKSLERSSGRNKFVPTWIFPINTIHIQSQPGKEYLQVLIMCGYDNEGD